MSNICVLGGCGFIGGHVAEYYANKNKEDTIYIIDSLYKDVYINRGKMKFYIKNYLEETYSNVIFIHRDIRNLKEMKNMFKIINPEVIFHLAGQVATTTSVQKPYEDFDINVRGTVSVLEAIRTSDINPTIIFSSTNKVYGDKVNNKLYEEDKLEYKFKCCEGINEKDEIDQTCHSPYGTSKLSADLYVQEYGYTYKLRTGVFRMSCIYGPRQMGYQEQGWIVHFILSALNDKTINIYGDGKQVRDLLYINDLVNVYDKFIHKESLKNEVFTMGGGKNNIISLLGFIEVLKRLLKKEIKIEFHPWRLADQRIYISDITKANILLDWKPLISPEEGIKRTVVYFRNFMK